MSAARLLGHARRGAGLSQRALAEAAGIPQSTIARIETRVLSPRVDTLERLLRAAGRTLSHEPLLGIGVDRTQIHEVLRLTPTQRARLAAGNAAGMRKFDRAIGRVVSRSAFDPVHQLEVLVEGGVRFVAIGSFAGGLHGSPVVTSELSVCVAVDESNLVALTGVLRSLRAEGSAANRGSALELDPDKLSAGDALKFETDEGLIEILGRPAGTSGYGELARTAERMEIDTVRVLVASLEDLMRIRRVAGRPVDLIELEVLGAVYEETERV